MIQWKISLFTRNIRQPNHDDDDASRRVICRSLFQVSRRHLVRAGYSSTRWLPAPPPLSVPVHVAFFRARRTKMTRVWFHCHAAMHTHILFGPSTSSRSIRYLVVIRESYVKPSRTHSGTPLRWLIIALCFVGNWTQEDGKRWQSGDACACWWWGCSARFFAGDFFYIRVVKLRGLNLENEGKWTYCMLFAYEGFNVIVTFHSRV